MSRAAVFLDRDGTVIVDADYLADPERVVLVPGAADAIRRLKEAGLAVVIVTNQSGIARGLYREADYHAVAERLDRVLAAAGASVDGTYWCPHHPDFGPPCGCRKPATGMYVRAAAELDLDPAASWFIGDKPTDLLPAVALGGRGILVRTGFGRESESRLPPGCAVADDLPAAADAVLRARAGTGPGGAAR